MVVVQKDMIDRCAARRIGQRIRKRSVKVLCILQPILLLWIAFVTCSSTTNPNSNQCTGPTSQFVQFVGASVATRGDDENDETKKQTRGRAKPLRPARPAVNKTNMTLNEILVKAGKRGLGGGLPGAIAGIVQVTTLMWLRTIINYQSRYGASFRQAVVVLFRDGGIRRFYRGFGFALVQAPLSRFVSTAANDGVQVLLASFVATQAWGPGRTTVVASLVVGVWRMLLMPIDTCKTVLQVDSVEGFRNLIRRVRAGRIGVLYQGAVANALSSIIGHYPWFLTFNALSNSQKLLETVKSQLLRNAFIGLVSSVVSDTVVNAIRVVKTTKQAVGSKHNVGYLEVIRMIVAADGWAVS